MATTVIQDGQPGSHARYHDSFLLHKLHSLSGIIPIGGFMVFHLVANSYSLRGEAEFNTVVKVIGYFPFVQLLEWGLIFLPILFHAAYGIFITMEMQGPGGNLAHYGYGRNWLYWLQRVSGIVALAYILFHVWSTTGHRYWYEWGGHQEEGFRVIAYQAMAYRFTFWWYLAIYLVGIAAATFHFGNGMFNFGIRWGLTIGSAAQKASAIVWSALGGALFVIAAATAINFHNTGMNYPFKDAQGNIVRRVNLQEEYSSLEDLVAKSQVAPVTTSPGAKPGEKAESGTPTAPGNAANLPTSQP